MLTMCVLLAGDAEIPKGSAQVKVDFAGTPIEVFTYKPETYNGGPILVVCHGVLRNAEEYRDHARPMADRFNVLVAAPKFAEPEFPKERYQFGGVSIDGKLKPRETWSGSFIEPIIADIRRREKKPELPYYCIGHSGGGQFLERMAGFAAQNAKSIVIANAGTHLFPTRDLPYPFGFGELPEDLSSDAVIRKYVEQPVVIYVGTKDLERDEHFDVTPPAEAQGKTRFERGKNVYAAAQALAKKHGWTCRWRLIEAEGVGHDHEKMFDGPGCRIALFDEAKK